MGAGCVEAGRERRKRLLGNEPLPLVVAAEVSGNSEYSYASVFPSRKWS